MYRAVQNIATFSSMRIFFRHGSVTVVLLRVRGLLRVTPCRSVRVSRRFGAS